MLRFKDKKSESVLAWIIVFFLSVIIIGVTIRVGFKEDPYALWPVLDQGRVKPFDTWAREWLLQAQGQAHYKGQSAVTIILNCIKDLENCLKEPFYSIDEARIRKAIGLEANQKRLSFEQIMAQPTLMQLFQKVEQKRQRQETLDPFLQRVARLSQAVATFQGFLEGQWPFVLPKIDTNGTVRWVAPRQFSQDDWGMYRKWIFAFNQRDEMSIKTQQEWLSQLLPYVDMRRIRTELFYNWVRPFRVGWWFYLIASLLGFIGLRLSVGLLTHLAYAFGGWGLIFHLLGTGIRIYIMGRPPVTNMFESVVWVGLVSVVVGIILGIIYRKAWLGYLSFLSGGILLILADLGHMVLGESLQPLEPVLRSQFWLITHVLTITFSYGCFALAYLISLIGTGLFFFQKERFEPTIKFLSLVTYRSLQVGVTFLAAGIVLGGVWADYSWGRFWGWDPKETWSLIALLGYLALMHARIQGWISVVGILVGSIVAFSLVVMAWYGVNYVLAAGLHSYGFGTGGLEVVLPLMIISLLWSIFVIFYHRRTPLIPGS